MAGRHRKPPSRGGQGRHRRSPQRRRLVAPALGSVLLLGAGGIAAAAAITGGNGPGVQPVQTPTATASPVATVTSVPTSPAPAAGSPSPAATPPRDRPAPALVVRVTGRVSWVEVTRAGGRVLYSGLLRHGREVVVRSGPVTAVIGDAGAVRLSRHGRVADPAGRPGEVVVLRAR